MHSLAREVDGEDEIREARISCFAGGQRKLSSILLLLQEKNLTLNRILVGDEEQVYHEMWHVNGKNKLCKTCFVIPRLLTTSAEISQF